MILKAVVHPADVQDRVGAMEVLEQAWSFRSLHRIFSHLKML